MSKAAVGIQFQPLQQVRRELGCDPTQRAEILEQEARTRGFAQGLTEGRSQGYEVGLAEGRLAGEDQIRDEMRATVEQWAQDLNRKAQAADVALATFFAQSEEAMTDLAMSIVRETLRAELALRRDSVLEIVRAALQEITHSKEAVIKVNPADSPLLMQHLEELRAASASLRKVQVIPDAHIAAGCILETDGGIVDARAEAFLDRAEARIEPGP